MSRVAITPDALILLVEQGVQQPAEHQLVAPGSVRSQVLDVLLARVNAGQLNETRALELHERLTAMKLRVLNDRVSRRTAWQIARAKGLDSVRDAEYLAVAKLQADVLVTTDQRLAELAAGIVPVAGVELLLG